MQRESSGCCKSLWKDKKNCGKKQWEMCVRERVRKPAWKYICH